MAGDWIKMRMDLISHPKVVRIMSAMRPHDVGTVTDKFRVIGGLHAVWCVFDLHSSDGRLHGYTPEALDHIIGWNGFAAALIGVQWLVFDGLETLAMPEFDAHNGKSAKRRAEDTKQKNARRKTDKSPHDVRRMSADDSDEVRTREEKRREDKDKEITPPVYVETGVSPDAPPAEFDSQVIPIKDPVPYEKILSLYHEVLPELATVAKLTTGRKAHIRSRWKNDITSLDSWRKYFQIVRESSFLMGRAPPGRDRTKPFLADFDFLINETNAIKVCEGKYHG